MKSMRTPLVLAVLGGLFLTGCSSEPEPLLTGEDYSVLAALGALPADASLEETLILTGDIPTASELAGLERPGDPADGKAVEWLSDLMGAEDASEVFVPLPAQLIPGRSSLEQIHDLLGWSVIDVDAFVGTTTTPGTFLAVSGDFSSDTLSAGLAEVEEGIVTDRQGDDGEVDLGTDTTLDATGQPTRLAQRDGLIALSGSTPLVRAWLAEETSMADQAPYAAVARALDAQGVYSAVLTPSTSADDFAVGGSDGSEQLEEMLPEQPFDVVGVGWAKDDNGTLISSAYHFDSDEAAEQAVASLRELHESGMSLTGGQPFSDYFTVEDAVADGEVVLVTLRPAEGARTGMLFDAINVREILFISR